MKSAKKANMKSCGWCGGEPAHDPEMKLWYCANGCMISMIMMDEVEWNTRGKDAMWKIER
jgi:hypothetical protein